MTVTDVPVTSTLATLTDSLKATASALIDAQESLIPHPDGISLLDVKNELLLSYLQNLALLVLLKIRNLKVEEMNETPSDEEEAQTLQQQIMHKLVELRVYLERGVRPLEGKLKYQIDSVLQAAETAKLSESAKLNTTIKTIKPAGDVSDSDASLDEDEDDNEEETAPHQSASIPGPRLQHQLTAKFSQQSLDSSHSKSNPKAKPTNTSSAPYRPPRHNPTLMPSDPSASTTRTRKPHSHLLNEFIQSELSSQPIAEPSIGTTLTQSGRSTLSARDREREAERTQYEESHFTRLPGESKAERRKRKKSEEKMGIKRDVMGGEDWSGLGGLGDRVVRSVSGGDRGRERENVLVRREKRRRDREEGQRGDGMGESIDIGGKFNRKRAIMEGREAKRRRR